MSNQTIESTELSLGMDPAVPYLASRAAVELDNLLLGQESDLTSVKALATRLSNATEDLQGTEDLQRLTQLDSPTVTVVHHAIVASNLHPAPTLKVIVAEAWKIASQLQRAEAGSSSSTRKVELEKMRSFCVALCQSASSYQDSIYESEPRHPYRS